ncbi:MAG: TIGR03905 family TSCPD domain-containing protein [Ruminococcaceae bacterium]|nr:TIGR03905 family TSCPD domain-containing protein [Oscillospiraceae bacterium]
MRYTYRPKGVCSMEISFDVDNDIVSNVSFKGGCNGNLQGISRLCEGRSKDEIIKVLSGIKCGFKSTSCPDQFAKALSEI